MSSISNRDDTIDYEDIIVSIHELELERCYFASALKEAHAARAEASQDNEDVISDLDCAITNAADDLHNWEDDYKDELNTLINLKDNLNDGDMIIHDDYFEEFAKNLAHDICDMKSADHWPFSCIDWAEAADQLKADYSTVDFDGQTFWVGS